MKRQLLLGLCLMVFVASGLVAAEASDGLPAGWEKLTPAERGYRFLTEKAYLPPDFEQSTFDETWTVWPEPLRSQAEKATPEERRKMAFSRYGLTPRSEDPTKPLQYVVDDKGVWTMNCFACHGGKVAGKTIPGSPNSRFALMTLTEETRQVKLAKQAALGRMDVGSMFMPLGNSNGTTNAVMFGVVLMGYRDKDLGIHPERRVPKMTHHDMDAPAWWHFQRKDFIYIDGFAAKGHRGLMQFMLVRQNGPEKFREWEKDFRDVYEYISSIEAPKYPYEVNQGLLEKGRVAFNRVCSDCHGTYGDESKFPNKTITLDEVKTDPVRYQSLTPAHRASYGSTWFTDYGKLGNIDDPKGYVAPPLNGVWASAPYFHNGSVPTLWHVLHPDARPVVWKRTEDGYDTKQVGLEVTTFENMPTEVESAAQKREYFNTKLFGKSAAGHHFPDVLTEDEKAAVLEYLKTL